LCLPPPGKRTCSLGSLPDRKFVLGKVVSVESAKGERKDEGIFMIVLKKKIQTGGRS